ADFFDIDWHPQNPSLDSKVLLPVLGGFYGPVLERGEIRLCYERGRFRFQYFDLRLPAAPHSLGSVIDVCAQEHARHFGDDDDAVQEFRSIATALKYLAPRSDLSADDRAERYREKESVRRRLARLTEANVEAHAAVERAIAMVNGKSG